MGAAWGQRGAAGHEPGQTSNGVRGGALRRAGCFILPHSDKPELTVVVVPHVNATPHTRLA